MAWIESHLDLAHHPKTEMLMAQLGLNRAQAIGHLHLLWYWTLTYAPDGDLSKYKPCAVARGAGWEGDPDRFVGELQDAGFINADFTVHDWNDYAGKLAAQRKANAERMKRARAEVCTARAVHVRQCAPYTGEVEEEDSTGPNQVLDQEVLVAEGEVLEGDRAAPAAAASLDQVSQILTGLPGWAPDQRLMLKLQTLAAERGLDLEAEALKIRDWIRSPKGKGRQCSGRFVLNWLQKGQSPPGAAPPDKPTEPAWLATYREYGLRQQAARAARHAAEEARSG